MGNIFDRIKQKAQQLFQGVGNFVDQTRQNQVQRQSIAQQRGQDLTQRFQQQREQRQQFLQQQADLAKKKAQEVLFNRQQDMMARALLAKEGQEKRKSQLDNLLGGISTLANKDTRGQYFNPESGSEHNFWKTHLAQNMAKVQPNLEGRLERGELVKPFEVKEEDPFATKAFKRVANFPIGVTNVPTKVLSKPLTDIVNQPASLIKTGDVVPYEDLKSPGSKLAYQAMGVDKTPTDFRDVASNVTELMSDFYNAFAFDRFSKPGTKPPPTNLKQAAFDGMKTGSKYGGLFAFFNSLNKNVQDKEVVAEKIASNVAFDTVVGVTGGAVAGATIGIAGYGLGKLVNPRTSIESRTLTAEDFRRAVPPGAENTPAGRTALTLADNLDKHGSAIEVSNETIKQSILNDILNKKTISLTDSSGNVTYHSSANTIKAELIKMINDGKAPDLPPEVVKMLTGQTGNLQLPSGQMTPQVSGGELAPQISAPKVSAPSLPIQDILSPKVAGFQPQNVAPPSIDKVIQPQTPVQQTTQPTKGVEALIQEARKYKSAEEFVDAKVFRDAHSAPGFDKTPVKQRMEEGGDYNLLEVVKGQHNQPSDYFDTRVGPRYYMYDDQQGMESLTAINNVKRGAKTVTAYRVVPKDIKVDKLIDGDWISFSKQYALDHGEHRFGEGAYKIIEQEVPAKYVWWDGNDIREWGYDTGKTKNLSRSELTDIWNKANQPKPLDEVLASKEITTPIEPSVDTQSINTQIKKLGTELGKVRAEIANPKPTSNLDALRTKEAQLRSEYSNLMRIKNNETPLEKILQTPPSLKSGLQKVYEDTLPIEFKGSFGVLEKSGEAGKKIVDTIKQTQKEIDLTAGGQIADLKKDVDWGLSEQEKLTLADAVEGKIEPISENQQKAIETWNAISKDIYDRAKEAGLDIGFRENYWPHFRITKSTGKAGKLGRSGQRTFGNLEKSRTSNAPFDKDPSVLEDYIKLAYERIIKAKNFGKADENLYNLAKETKDAGQTNKYLDQILRKNQEPSDITKFATTYNTVTKLKHTTALLNLTQNLSTALRTDIGSTAKGVAKAIFNPKLAMENAIRAGELDASTKRVFEDYAGSSDLTGFWIRFIGMEGTENFNRIVAVNAGMEYYAKLNTQALNGSKSALREIEKLGMKVNGNPIEAGRKISEETQFDTSPGNLPYNWKTNVGKIATQFKSFAYKQTGFAADQIKRSASEAGKGNFKPLINALLILGIAAPIVGEIVSGAKSIFHNRKRTTTGMKRYLENITSATSFGLIDDFDALFGKYGGQGVVSTLLGPTAGEIYNAGQNVEDLKSDNIYDNRKAYRRLLRTIPIAGPTLANTLVPNSYVDNVWGGVNEGLSESDKEAYNEIKAVDPQKAEEFKASKQAQRDERNKEDNWLNKLFSGKSGKDIEAPSPGASKKEIDDFNDKMRTILDEGHIPSQEALKDFATKGKDPFSNSIEEKQDAFSYLEKEMTNEFYTDEQKEALLKASEVDPDDYYYYERASKTNLVKLQEILPEIEQMDEKEMMIYLMQGRKTIAGKMVIADGVVNELYEMGYLTKDQKNAIKALKYNEITGEFNYKRDYSGKSSSNLTYKQAMALFKIDLPKFSEIKSPSPFSKPSAKGSATAEKTLDEILNFNPKKQTSIQDQWFKT